MIPFPSDSSYRGTGRNTEIWDNPVYQGLLTILILGSGVFPFVVRLQFIIMFKSDGGSKYKLLLSSFFQAANPEVSTQDPEDMNNRVNQINSEEYIEI